MARTNECGLALPQHASSNTPSITGGLSAGAISKTGFGDPA
jgi:hypothetical protein